MQVVFPVRINSLGTVKDISFSLAYDPSLLSNPSAQMGAGVAAGQITVSNLSGFVGVSISGATIPAGQGVLCNITFDVADNATRNSDAIAILTWDKIPVYPVIRAQDGTSLSWGANTGIIHLGTGVAESLNVDILGESQTATAVSHDPAPIVNISPNPMPMPTPVAPTPIIPAAFTATPTSVNALPSLLTGFSLGSFFTNHTALVLGSGLGLYLLTKKKKRGRKF